MESVSAKENVHHGRNIKLARNWKNITQEGLAELLNLKAGQGRISELEMEETIDDKILDDIAKALDVPVDFLKNFQPDQVLKSFTQTENQIDISTSDNSSAMGQGEQIITNYNYPIDKVVEMYERLMKEKDEQTARFEKQIIDLVKQVEELKTRIK